MKYIKQVGIVLIVSFFGEVLNYFIPLPIPASIYGLIVMLACLNFGIVKIEAVRHTSYFLIEIMPLMFIPAAVGLITSWNVIHSNLVAYIVITVVSTFAVMLVSGYSTQFVLRHGKK